MIDAGTKTNEEQTTINILETCYFGRFWRSFCLNNEIVWLIVGNVLFLLFFFFFLLLLLLVVVVVVAVVVDGWIPYLKARTAWVWWFNQGLFKTPTTPSVSGCVWYVGYWSDVYHLGLQSLCI